MGKKLLKRAVDSFTYQGDGKSRDVRWDSGDGSVKGFGVRIYPSGKKSFVLFYRTKEGRQRFLVIGQYGELTVDQAREKAKGLVGAVTRGEDPLSVKKQERHGETVKDLCIEFLDRHASLKKTAGEYRRRIEAHILPAWGTMKAKAIKRADVAALHHRIGKKAPYEANRVLALVSVIFQKGREWGFLPESHINPAREIQTYKERKRDRWVTREELPRLAAAIGQEPSPYVRAAIWLYLLTGARKSELLNLRWTDVDLARAEINLADTKAGRPHHIPLSAEAMAILGTIPRLEGNPFIFPGKVAGRPLVNVAKSWRRIRKTAELEDVRLHDLRRTVGSWLATGGASLPLIGKVLGHSQPSTTAIYARLSEDPARAALERHGAELMEVAKGLRVVK